VVSHDLGLASRFCDRLAVLAEGEIIAVGRPSQVLVPPVIRRAFGIDATILEGPDGAPLVVPRLASAAAVGAPPRSAGGGTDPDPGTPA
jgi:iron complex transport system ATP-binding protein